MQREYIKWKSPSLGRDMEMLVFGKGGTPVLVFPTDHGRFFEWEDHGTIDQFTEQLESEFNQFFFVDSVSAESFLNSDVDPYTRLVREEQFELYIIDEVLPFIGDVNNTPYLITAGAELGAYQALRIALKNPELFDKVISISGYYDINVFLDGFRDDTGYFNNPIEFLPNLNDDAILKSISSLDLRLISYLNDSHKSKR